MSMFGNAQSVRWLLAEITVVVLGILIAFQVEEWRTYRGDRQVEQASLIAVLQDLDSATGEYEKYGQFLDKQREQASEMIDLLQSPREQVTKEEIIQLAYFYYSQIWQTSQSAFLSLQETGQLVLVSDEVLRSQLIDYFNVYEPFFLKMTGFYSRGRRELGDMLGQDFELVPLPDYRSNRKYRTVLRIDPSEFPTHPDAVSGLIELDTSALERRDLTDKGIVKVGELRAAILEHLDSM